MLRKALWLSVVLAFGCAGEPGGDDAAIDDGAEKGLDDSAIDGANDSANDGFDAPADEDVEGPDDADGADSADGDWTNPGCSAAPNVVADDLRLSVWIDLRDQAQGIYHVREIVSVRPSQAGESIALFGEGFALGRASASYRYDGHLAVFCTGPFAEGDDVSVEVEYDLDEEARPNLLRSWGLHRFTDGQDTLVVGAFNEPYFAPFWLLVPQSLFSVDAAYDDSPAVSAVDLSIVPPDDTWTVVGPGGPARRESDGSWNFSLHRPMPLYSFSFAASPDYEVFSAGKTASGMEVLGAVPPSLRESAETVFGAAVTAVDWLEEHLGPYEFGDFLTLAAVPRFGGGMENTTIIWLGNAVISPDPNSVFVAVHETVHHWWGDNVRFADWPHFWLAEGFDEWTTNFNLMAVFEDEEAFRARRTEYRVQAAALSSRRIPGFGAAGPLRFGDDQNMMNHFVYDLDLFYKYGAAFLEMIHQRLLRDFGTDLGALLRVWFADHHLTSQTTESFLAFLQTSTGDTATWAALFDDWVYKTPCPTLSAGDFAFAGGTASFRLTRSGGDQALPGLEILFVNGTDEVRAEVDLAAGADQVDVAAPLPNAPDRIVIDPDGFFILRLKTAVGWTGPAVEASR